MLEHVPMKGALWGALAALAVAGCNHTLPPAETPQATLPLEPGPPPEGQGRLIVDVVDGPTRVDRVFMAATETVADDGSQSYVYSGAPEPLCDATPCVLDLPPGNILLRFPVRGGSTTEDELVHISEGTSVYRRALSTYHPGGVAYGLLGIFPLVVGIGLTIPGIVLLPVGAANDDDGLLTDSIVFLSVGGGLTLLGAIAMALDAPERQAGSSIHFAVE